MFFIEKAKDQIRRWYVRLPDDDLAYLPEHSEYFNDYVKAVHFAQAFALASR